MTFLRLSCDGRPDMDESFLITLSGCSLLAGGLLIWLATRPSYRLRVTPCPLQLVHFESADATLVVERKRRLALRWRPVAGTFIVQRGDEGKVAACPTLGSSAADESGFVLHLTGREPGVDHVRVSATPAGSRAALVLELPVTVVHDQRGSRRIRDTVAVLSAPSRE